MQNPKVKICFVTETLSNGGAERVVAVLASQLAQEGHEVSVIKYFDVPNEYPVDENVHVICASNGNESTYKTFGLVRKIAYIRRALKESNAEYVVPFLPHVAAHVFAASFGLSLRSIQTIRIAPNKAPASLLLRRIRDFLVCCSYATFVQTDSQKKYFPRLLHHKIKVLPNPVSEEMFRVLPEYPESITRIISMGRLTAQKNFPMLIDAVEEINTMGIVVQLDIYGEGELRSALQSQIESRNCQEFCHLCGRTEKVREVLQTAHLFVLPSNFEGMPNALMEAMAAGLPCISTDCETGPKELLKPGTGLLVAVNDQEAMTGAILHMIRNPEEAKQMGMRAKAYMAENYCAKVISHKFIREVVFRRDA